MKRILSLVLAIIMAASLVGCKNGKNEKKPIEYGEFETALRFVVASDVHISKIGDKNYLRFEQLFKSSYQYAESQEYQGLDAVVIVGDLTYYGYASEYASFNRAVNDNIKEGTQLITVMGNHEAYGQSVIESQRLYKENMDPETNKHVVIKGYHFIGISQFMEGDYSRSTAWLAENLEQAYNDDPNKPIITFQHHHIKDTVYVSHEWSTQTSYELDTIYSKYSTVLNFSGHSHAPINNPTSVYQKDYSLFGTGTLAYFEMASGMTYGTVPPNSNDAAQFYIVEISTDNRVRVLPYNLLTDDFFKTADGSKQLIYSIDNLKDKSTWLYTEKRAKNAPDPYFESGSEISFDRIGKTILDISFPQAKDQDCVYSYNIKLEDTDGNTLDFNYFSEYYFEPMPERLEFRLRELTPDTKYKITVTPINVYGKIGEGITSEFTTLPQE